MNIQLPSDLVTAWPLILAAVAMLLQSVANQPWMNKVQKKIVTIATALLVTLVYMLASGIIVEFPWAGFLVHWIIYAAITFVIGQAIYQFFSGPLNKLESFTSFKTNDGPE